jgi:hypothetical protein
MAVEPHVGYRPEERRWKKGKAVREDVYQDVQGAGTHFHIGLPRNSHTAANTTAKTTRLCDML